MQIYLEIFTGILYTKSFVGYKFASAKNRLFFVV